MSASQLNILQQWIDESSRIVFFGGAGVSTESGIPDFRSEDGLYHQKYRYPPETILSHDFFLQNPEEFWSFYRSKILIPNSGPNRAHKKLYELEALGKLTAVITQNIDGLHEEAGSRKVFPLHGSVSRNVCMDCGRVFDVSFIKDMEGVPLCPCGGIIKPDVVLYGESLDAEILRASIAALKRADLVIVGGTSLAVYPAAGLLDYYEGQRLVLLNISPTPYDQRANLLISGSIGDNLAQIRAAN